MKKFAPYVVILTIIALGAFVWLREEKAAVVVESTEQVSIEGVGTSPDKEPVSGIDTLAALAGQGKSLECQVVLERSEVEGNIEGTYFTHQGKLRGDFLIPAPEFGGTILSSMIVDTDILFVWSTINGETIGFKSDLTTRDTSIPTKEPIALDQPVRYTCTQWDAYDGSVFIPPASVSFTDATASVKAGMEYGILPN